jgi:hypothetical protein
MAMLADRAGSVVSRGDLVELVWGLGFSGDSALARSVAELRQSLGEVAENPRSIWQQSLGDLFSEGNTFCFERWLATESASGRPRELQKVTKGRK